VLLTYCLLWSSARVVRRPRRVDRAVRARAPPNSTFVDPREARKYKNLFLFPLMKCARCVSVGGQSRPPFPTPRPAACPYVNPLTF